ncbi:MAG: hypothetical protein WC137_01100 [Alphaproteobacteria bacterium]
MKEHNEFVPMALIGCFLLDKNFDIVLFWSILFCFLYAAAGLQNIINFADRRLRSIDIFMIFVGSGTAILGIWSSFLTASLIPVLTAIWMFVISTVLYATLTYMFERIECWTKR